MEGHSRRAIYPTCLAATGRPVDRPADGEDGTPQQVGGKIERCASIPERGATLPPSDPEIMHTLQGG